MTQTINPSKWKISLPTFPPDEVMDNSTSESYGRCPRLGLYRYGLRRGFGGKSYSIQFGLAYHKYREVVENLMRESGEGVTGTLHTQALDEALVDFEDPPIGDKKEYLNRTRLFISCEKAKERIIAEQESGSVVVTRAEDSFDLELPFYVCGGCGYGILVEKMELEDISIEHFSPICPNKCDPSHLFRARHGGRVDQFVQSRGKSRIKDFKTTAYKGKRYEEKFSPSGQMQGYVWSGTELSGRNFDGALIETLHNTKTIVAQISQHYVSFTQGQQEQWLASRMMEHSMIHMMWSRVEELGFLAFPQRTSECSNFAGCGFREACQSSSAKEIENWLENYTVHSEWDFAAPDKEVSKVK